MHFIPRKKGSSLVLVIVLTFALSAVVAGLLQSLVFDKRLNRRIHLAGEARNAAEGAVEVAVAEIDRRAASYSSLTTNTMADFTFPDAMRTFLASGHVASSSLEFKAGNFSPLPPAPITIDGTDPFNLPDIDKGKPVILRHGYVYGKATAVDPASSQSVTSYISNVVQIREQTWLNYAVFYNLDMEMHSGSTMDVDGPVHCNRNAYLTAGGSQKLRFYGGFTTPKKIYRKYKYGGTVTHTGDVLFPPKEDPSASELLTMSMSEDSTKSGFKIFAENRWKGFVQDASFAVPVFNPPGLLQYEPDDHTTTSTNERRNNAWAMIEPQLADVSSDNVANHEYYGFKGEGLENQKFSALAGLTIRVKPVSTWPATPPTAASVIAGTDPGFEVLYYTGSTNSSRPVNRSNLPDRHSSSKKPIENVIDLTKAHPTLLAKLLKAVVPVKYVENTSSGTAGNRALVGVDSDPVTSGSQTWYGIYDRRQGYDYPASSTATNANDDLKGAHHAVHLDLGAFNTFINAPTAEWEDQTDTSVKLYVPDAYYSGVVYVQTPMLSGSDSAVSARKTTDKIRPAVAPNTTAAGYAVILRNAGTLPSLPSDLSKRDDGFSFVTNAPVYIKGHYNADGDSSTGSSTSPDSSNELPALIAADAVTILSSAFSDSDMSLSATLRPASDSALNASFTEVATGIIAGIVPTKLNSSGVGTNNQWAGGVHNFVRFLEDWTGINYRYRGSIVALYENEVSLGPWHQSYYAYWYDFPSRDVGYHVYFSGGRFPPGLPVMRTVRRISVADITKAQYDAGPPTPPAAAN